MEDVVIIESSPQWRHEYRLLADALRGELGDTALRVDHIGSTSVPDLPAKDILDVQVTVVDAAGLLRACALLGQHGYSVHADRLDHSVGDESDDAWRKGFASEKPGHRRCNIHVRVAGRPNQTYALLFRDYLRAHAATARAYATFKKKVAGLLPEDSARYTDLKDPVCDLIYLPALEWAKATGWAPTSD